MTSSFDRSAIDPLLPSAAWGQPQPCRPIPGKDAPPMVPGAAGLSVLAASCYREGVPTTRHQRFAITAVTYAGVSLPGATVDLWHDSAGQTQWSARIVIRAIPVLDEGGLTG